MVFTKRASGVLRANVTKLDTQLSQMTKQAEKGNRLNYEVTSP